VRLAFLGTPVFAVPVLEALIAAGHEIPCVYAQPPRPAGRGHKLQNTPVHEAALKHGIEVRTPLTLKAAADQQAFASLNLDAAIVVAYGLLLPKAILDAPRLGCFNLHASLLPRWRGAAPIHRAIMAGDTETGVMVMKMDEGLDTGPVLSTWRTTIDDATTTGDLQGRLSTHGAQLMVDAMTALAAGTATLTPQPADGVTYAKKILPAETRIDWTRPARELVRFIHALNPAPGAWTMHGETRIRLLRATLTEGKGEPGTMLEGTLRIACGEGAIEIRELQRAGRGVQSAEEFSRGYALAPGARLA
jgi:methionyl-tRNA formyltransferase